MKKVYLDEGDIELCELIAGLRETCNKAQKYEDRRGSKNRKIGYQGLLGEYAFAKKFNLFLNLCIAKKPGRAHIDFYSPKGLTIDVKTTSWGKNTMNVNAQKPEHPDYYVCCMVKEYTKAFNEHENVWELDEVYPPEVYLVGWISKNDFITKSKYVNPQAGTPFHSLEFANLKKSFPQYIFGK
tara:strand:+ start:2579 stop:3127 length:549 start_codon:yes stop_codon:yes gene_type:complete